MPWTPKLLVNALSSTETFGRISSYPTRTSTRPVTTDCATAGVVAAPTNIGATIKSFFIRNPFYSFEACCRDLEFGLDTNEGAPADEVILSAENRRVTN